MHPTTSPLVLLFSLYSLLSGLPAICAVSTPVNSYAPAHTAAPDPAIGPWPARGWPHWLKGAGNQQTFKNTAFAQACLTAYDASSPESAPYGRFGVCRRPAPAVPQAPNRPVNASLTVAASGNGQFDCTAILVLPRKGQDSKCDPRVFKAIYDHYVDVGHGLPIGGGSWNIDQDKFPGPNGNGRVEDALLDTRHPGYVLIPSRVLPVDEREYGAPPP